MEERGQRRQLEAQFESIYVPFEALRRKDGVSCPFLAELAGNGAECRAGYARRASIFNGLAASMLARVGSGTGATKRRIVQAQNAQDRQVSSVPGLNPS